MDIHQYQMRLELTELFDGVFGTGILSYHAGLFLQHVG